MNVADNRTMPHRDCARCQELVELVAELQVKLVEKEEASARASRAMLLVQRHIAGIGDALEDGITGVTGISPNGTILDDGL